MDQRYKGHMQTVRFRNIVFSIVVFTEIQYKDKRKHTNLPQVKTSSESTVMVLLMPSPMLMLVLMSGPFSLDISAFILPLMAYACAYVAPVFI